MIDTMECIERDLKAVFGYDGESRPQERAHAYLTENRVLRGFDDTAMQVAAGDMARRAYEVGRREAAEERPVSDEVAAELVEQAGRLLKAASALRGCSE